MTHVHASLLHSADDADVASFVERLAAKRPRSISTTEATGFRAAFDVDPYVVVHDRGVDGQAESALLVRLDAFRKALPAVRLSDLPIPRRGGRHVYAARVDTVDGQLLAVHMPSGVEGPTGLRANEQASVYRDAIGGLRQYVATHPRVTEIYGDWNLHAELEWVQVYFKRHFPGFDIVAPSTATHAGGRVIDWALVRRGREQLEATTRPNPVSDHEVVVFEPVEVPVASRIIARSEWGARPPRGGPGPLDPDQVEGIALHWPAMLRPLRGIAAVSAALRNWQAHHMDTNGWSDIGYQEAYDQDGNRYLLRGMLTQSGANGDEDVNERFGAYLLVLAPGEQPTEAMMAAVRAGIARHRAAFPGSRRIVGHGQIRPGGSRCPGPITQALIDAGEFAPPNREEETVTPEDIKAIAEQAATLAVDKLLATKINTETGEWTVKQILRGTYNNVVGEEA